jgi:hypothetical protein
MIGGKCTKAEVNYGPGRPNIRCGLCMNYRVPMTCTIVEGDVDPDYVCDAFNHTPLTVGEEE